MKPQSANPVRFRSIGRVIEPLLLLTAAIFLGLHALHLSADFPNHSPWMDWAKYTDEGWYGDAAIRHFQLGHWYVPGDFNPAVALPVWPLLEAALFRFTGVNLVAARALTVAIFALILLSSYLLLRRWHRLSSGPHHQEKDDHEQKDQQHHPEQNDEPRSLAPALAVLLLAVSPFCYVFTRLAILEPLLILLTLLALLAASYTEPQPDGFSWRKTKLSRILPLLALGLLIPLMVLTKTTAIFLLPSIAWLLWARSGYSLRSFIGLSLPPALVAAVLWLAYYGLVVRPHFLLDYRYLFSANAYTGINPGNALSVLGDTLNDGIWMGKLLYPVGLLAVLYAFLLRPRLLRNPLVPALVLWAAGYAAFLAYHNNLQPRYYLVLAVPLTALVPVIFEPMWTRSKKELLSSSRRLGGLAIATVLVLLVISDASQTLSFVRTPDYTFATAARKIRDVIIADPAHNPLVLSISGSNLSLMTGLPSICDDFGTMDLAMRVQAYHPGWYVAWNQVDDDKMDALVPMFRLQRIAAFPAMDDPERNQLILYRLDPASPPSPAPAAPRRKTVRPHLLQINFGQMLGEAQLVH